MTRRTLDTHRSNLAQVIKDILQPTQLLLITVRSGSRQQLHCQEEQPDSDQPDADELLCSLTHRLAGPRTKTQTELSDEKSLHGDEDQCRDGGQVQQAETEADRQLIEG